MKIKTVFLDMDGVLVNFNKSACALLDLPYPPSEWHWYKNVPDGFNKVNEKCNVDFWANLEWHSNGKEIFSKVVEKFGINNIYLLTTPMPNPGSGTGKILWVEKNIPVLIKQLIVTRAPKSLLAKSDTLLIDDKDENVDEFVRAGGQAILVPRSWNKLWNWENPHSSFQTVFTMNIEKASYSYLRKAFGPVIEAAKRRFREKK